MRTWQSFDDSSVERLQRQMTVVGEREAANARMLFDFVADFLDGELRDEDGERPMARISTNVRETMRELVLCNVQRQRALEMDIGQCVADMHAIVEKHDERVKRKLAR